MMQEVRIQLFAARTERPLFASSSLPKFAPGMAFCHEIADFGLEVRSLGLINP